MYARDLTPSTANALKRLAHQYLDAAAAGRAVPDDAIEFAVRVLEIVRRPSRPNGEIAESIMRSF